MEYLYTDSLKMLKDQTVPLPNQQDEEPLDIDILLDLLQLSYDFKIEKLRKLCQDALEPAITIENSSIILKRVNEIGSQAEDLKTTCLNYILLNYQQVIQTGSFYELPKMLIKEINLLVAQHGVKVNINSRGDNNH